MLENKRVLIYGYGRSGQSALNLLLMHHINAMCYDEKNITGLSSNLIVKNISKKFLKNIDLIVVNPAVSIFNKDIKLAKKMKIPVISELQLGFDFIKNDVIAVTGTDGKSTTVSIINHILNTEKKENSYLAGNIGTPLSKMAMNAGKYQYAITEVSSFMLEAITNFKPSISVITNISSDHLDRHKNLKNYIKTKFNIFKNQTYHNFCVLNYDDNILRRAKNHVHAQLFWTSLKEKVKGAYCKDNAIYFFNGIVSEFVMNVSNIKLVGKHNLSNVLSAVCVCKLLGVKNSSIKNAINSFNGLEHRIEFVAEKNNIKFYNDSKSTTIQSCICAVNSFVEPVVLIMGGSSKNQDYSVFAKKIPANIVQIFLVGEIKNDISKCLEKANFKSYCFANSIEEATENAFKFAKSGSIVLLSPSTASFDMFKSFEERGLFFKAEVKKLIDEK